MSEDSLLEILHLNNIQSDQESLSWFFIFQYFIKIQMNQEGGNQNLNNSEEQQRKDNQEEQEQKQEQGQNQEEQKDEIQENEQEENEESEKSEISSLDNEKECSDKTKKGCKHYLRGCQLYCNTCEEFFACRLCHDEVKYDSEMDPKKNHQINRHQVTRIKCLHCEEVQPSQKQCQKCKKEFSKYFCSVCNFFDDDEKKKLYHCEQCGICRVGVREEIFHCQTCNACFPNSMKDTHKCMQNRFQQNCTICMEDMFSSRKSSQILKCGHSMHSKCLNLYMKTNFSCPICKKSLYDQSHSEKFYDQQVEAMKMPEEYKDWRMKILCNDCLEKCEVPFHLMSGKCTKCKSYNTTRLDVIKAELKK